MNASNINRAVMLSAAMLLSACATPSRTHTMASTFDPSEVLFSESDGSATVSGNAFITQRNGGVVTCAGKEVLLIPRSQYAEERLTAIYGGSEKGYNRGVVRIQEQDGTNEIDQQFIDSIKKTRCNSDGNFTFKNVPDGTYFIETNVTWEVPTGRYTKNIQGGNLMQAVVVDDNEDVELIVTI